MINNSYNDSLINYNKYFVKEHEYNNINNNNKIEENLKIKNSYDTSSKQNYKENNMFHDVDNFTSLLLHINNYNEKDFMNFKNEDYTLNKEIYFNECKYVKEIKNIDQDNTKELGIVLQNDDQISESDMRTKKMIYSIFIKEEETKKNKNLENICYTNEQEKYNNLSIINQKQNITMDIIKNVDELSFDNMEQMNIKINDNQMYNEQVMDNMEDRIEKINILTNDNIQNGIHNNNNNIIEEKQSLKDNNYEEKKKKKGIQ
ncbi:hypothetical protein PFMALIP_05066 [Plasmodium falciparum MaliPS096_E11]|nr:hypothetical protein PFMALIP_05066 [Plasmodium falciparum MaliPS096_E11]